ncbi:hypothetical protein HHL22_20460 [Hymenobacter sp. RP-2-7]|uniref:Uncharacterized protein n=1 Tax=Hymenobacter polaris TaxID=2682546 RepID=A0A7Y0AI90_9BACT|nr:hypothetical protein [Hymenobacter polaris]NML67580.1 hypothetical protein [Hymenobacter polaris]
MPTPVENPRRAELLTALSALGLEEQRDFWLIYNGTSWKLRWFAHATPEQHVQGDQLVNSLLNN